MTQRSVRQALTDLHAALRELVDPIHRKVLRDGGHTTTHTAPSLLDQLRDATGTSGESGGGGRGSRNPIPIDPDAVDLLGQITTETTQVHTYTDAHTQQTIEERARATVRLVEQWNDIDDIDWATGWLTHWRRAIEDKIDPREQYHLAAPCPACDVRMARRADPADPDWGQLVSALLVDTRAGVTCQACEAHWPPDEFDRLAELIRDHLPDLTRREQSA